MMNYLAQAPGQVNPITNPALGDVIRNKKGDEFVAGLIPAIISLGILAGILIFVAVMILGAMQWMNSGGDKAAIEGARGKVVNAFFGLVLLFSVFALLQVIEHFFGLKILSIDINSFGIK